MSTPDVAPGSPTTIEWWRDEPVTPLDRSVAEWRSVVMDAYAMLPTLCITRAQGQRLWGMSPTTCQCERGRSAYTSMPNPSGSHK